MREPTHKYIPGDHWMLCDECGFRYRRSEMRERWDHAWVCEKDWEPKHPQENVKVVVDRVAVDVARPEPDSSYVSPAITQDDL